MEGDWQVINSYLLGMSIRLLFLAKTTDGRRDASNATNSLLLVHLFVTTLYLYNIPSSQ